VPPPFEPPPDLEPPPPFEPVLWEPPPAGAVPVCGDPPVAPVCDPLGAGLLPVPELVLGVPLLVGRLGLVGATTGVAWTGVWLVTAGVT
jgi:hypothetical protein